MNDLPSPSSEENLRPTAEEAPPLLGQWSRVYSAVMLYLLCLLACLSAISRAFRY